MGHGQIIPAMSDNSPLSNSPICKSPSEQQRTTILDQIINADSFHRSIEKMISFAENEPNSTHAITDLCSKFGFQRRRIYDVINVLCAIGCCKKSSIDTITWLGMKGVPRSIQKQIRVAGIASASDSSLRKIVQNDRCISIGPLTSSFILCFFALNKRSLSIKEVSAMLSQENNRFRTTLCKLYQISHILEAASVIEKTSAQGEVRLREKYFSGEMPSPSRSPSIPEICSIESLLNHPSNLFLDHEDRQ